MVNPHIAVAEKLLAEPPKERIDRIVVETKVAGWDRFPCQLRRLVQQVRELDAQMDQRYAPWRAGDGSRGRRQRPFALSHKIGRKLPATFPKFWRAQKQLSLELGREPTAEDLADELHLPVSRINGLLKMARQPVSLDAPMGRMAT